MGDVLDTLPALTDAMNAIPSIRFDWVVEENFFQIPTWHAAVDRVIPVAIRRWRKNWFSRATRQQRIAFKYILQQRTYKAVIDAQGLIKSAALITRLAKGSKHGQDCKSAREPIASCFYNYRYEISNHKHAIERTRQLFAKILGYDQSFRNRDHAIAEKFITHSTVHVRQYLVFLHSTTRNEKHWPEQNWRTLITLIVNSGLRVKLPWGKIHERHRALRLAEGFSQSDVEVLPQLDLQQIAFVLAGAKGVVSVDTGLSHLTAALNKPNITLFGPTNPFLIGSYGRNQYACLPLQSNKMAHISAQQVYTLLKKHQVL